MKKITLFLFLLSLSGFKQEPDPRTINFPKKLDYPTELPKKQQLWIFLLAGQSNMAGRGLVEPEDTVFSSRVLALGKDNRWYYAKEPLHFYEPALRGLDCGLSFGKEMIQHVDESITIGIVPCAIGGSSVEQWLGDSTHRDVKLLTNFKKRARQAARSGVIQGILWHQGESNAHEANIVRYRSKLKKLFTEFRKIVKDESLPVLVGELGPFLKAKDFQAYGDSVNAILRKLSTADGDIIVVPTSDLTHKGDSLHFDARSLRMLGQRYAKAYKSAYLKK